MRFAYADPPYVGQAAKHYGAPEVDHQELIARLVGDFPDGWALSCSSPSLGMLLRLAPADTRVGAWVKPFASFKPGVNPAFAWEPVLFRGGRKRGRDMATVRDWVSANITLQKGLSGAKPPAFCQWVLDILGWQPGDELLELYPGTHSMTNAIRNRQEIGGRQSAFEVAS